MATVTIMDAEKRCRGVGVDIESICDALHLNFVVPGRRIYGLPLPGDRTLFEIVFDGRFIVSAAFAASGVRRLSEMKRATGTTTPSPVRWQGWL